MQYRTILPFALALALAAVPASAQQVSLTIDNGLVNLEASNASLRQILDAWSRVGGTRIVNAEQVSPEPLTLKLVNVPEREALEVILRSVAGYMAAPRAASATPGASLYDRILVLPTSTGEKVVARNADTPERRPFFRGRPFQGRDEVPGADGALEEPPAFAFPEPGDPANQQAVPFGGANGGQSPFGQPQPAQSPFGQTAPPAETPFGQPQPTQSPFGQPQPVQQTPFGQVQPGTPFGQPAQQTPFGQIQPVPGNQAQPWQGQSPVVNPFAAAMGVAQPQTPPAAPPTTPPAGSFTIIGSPTPGVVSQPQPTPPPRPFGKPPGKQQQQR